MLAHDAAGQFFAVVVAQARARGLISADHFTVDGTLIEAWASMKSFRPKGDDSGDTNGWSDFRGQSRSNDTHESKTDPEAKLARKSDGQAAKLSFSGHALMENRNGLLVDMRIEQATGKAEQVKDRKLLFPGKIAPRNSEIAFDHDLFFTKVNNYEIAPG